MSRFVAIEHNSGLVWGEAETETAAEACSKIDATTSGHPACGWHQVSPITDTDGGYHLYEVTDPDLDDCYFEAGMWREVQAHCVYVGDYRPDAELCL